ncbi:zinc finger protein 704 isoform X1 [Plutella xylostella]|uniref:zinc finger protein 704 isoform X1 n=1 Tax=Plutella xylostella TaxID=51655 RepID=UPI0020322CB0|nr:zinc finger protein 704 isoform X1 [Plutella xylostella]
MSTGKRLAKRSIIGTRVAAPVEDGLYLSGTIQAVKTPSAFPENNNCINLTPATRYTVRLEGVKGAREYRSAELIGPGFRSLAGVRLRPPQRVFLTHNGREVCAEVLQHDAAADMLRVRVLAPHADAPIELKKRLDEIRLLESRKSARLADSDTDFARLADMAGDRRRASATIEVPAHHMQGSRKRRPSSSGDLGYGERDDMMNECNAALVLMSLSCSPNSPRPSAWGGRSSVSPGASSSSGSSWRSGTPSPPPASSSFSDESGIAIDYEDLHPRKKKINSVVFECTWRGCGHTTNSCAFIEAHIRNTHLGPKKEGESDHEEEFYYTEREMVTPAAAPTLSHRDMCRPPHEDPDYQRQLVGSFRSLPTLLLYALGASCPGRDMCRPPHEHPDYQRQLVGSFRQGLLQQQQQNASARPISIPVMHSWSNSHSPKHMRLSLGGAGGGGAGRRARSDNKKCRKVYGMEHRELWCTQCKWKKACTRFGD